MVTYGVGDASYLAAGGAEGLVQLATAFYSYMASRPEAAAIRAMHPEDLGLSRDKLAAFLAGWLGGPKLFMQRFGPISIPAAHAHLAVDEPERDAWMLCMRLAVADQPWAPELKVHFMTAIAVPAERVRVVSVERRQER